jgi:hypothetical protein
MRQNTRENVCFFITIEKHLDKYLQQLENVLNVVSTVVVGILNIFFYSRC